MTSKNDNNESATELIWWRDLPHYAEAVESIRRDLPLADQDAIDNNVACFGHAWVDVDGECPEQDVCRLAKSCSIVWKIVQVKRGQGGRILPSVPSHAVMPLTEPESVSEPVPQTPSIAPVAPQPLVEPSKPPRRRKYEESNLYRRDGYENLGRPCDEFVDAFVDALGDPPHLPQSWTRKSFTQKYGHLGSLLLSVTRSYHTLLFEGRTVIRLHTSSAKHCATDIAPELVTAVQNCSRTLSVTKTGQRQLSSPVKLTAKQQALVKPCRHRVIVRSVDAAIELAKIVHKQYRT